MRLRTITRLITGDPDGVVVGDIPDGEVAGEGDETDSINHA
jgi:hypothetical protein